MRVALSIFFLIIFSLQALPVKVLGKTLLKQQLTEEVENFGCDDNSNEEEAQLGNDYTTTLVNLLYPTCQTPCMHIYMIDVQYIYRQYVADTPTQPPNC